jgi:hypothetical protein
MSRNTAILVFRVLAILALLAAIGPGAKVLPALVIRWADDPDADSSVLLVASLLAPIVLPLILAAGLWLGAPAFARSFSGTDTAASFSFEALEKLALAVVGVFLLGVALPNLAKLTYYYWQLSTPAGVQIGTDVERKGALIETVIQLGIGLWLVFGASGLAGRLQKLRGR